MKFTLRRHSRLIQPLRIMRLSAVFLLGAALQVSASGYSQQKITINVKNVPVEQVFNQIKQQTGLAFIWEESVLKQTHPVTVDLKNVSIDEALDACLKDQPITYTIKNDLVEIRQKNISPPSAQENSSPPIDIHGHVTDSLGNPVAGATVMVKGSKEAATVTDANGNFSLRSINSNSTLIISNVGFETQEFKVKGKSDISLRLKVHSTTLLDVVVNKGYYSTSQRLNTGNVSIVTSKEIEEQPVSDPILALIGRVPGLNIIQTSGVPGSYSTIQLRGQNSIANGNDPFYIVDGVPFSSTSLSSNFLSGGVLGQPANGPGLGMSPFNALNPSDIESVEVLKDADATAIYGSRGANGVILITTKKGKIGQTRFDVNAFTGLGTVTRKLDMLNTPQYLTMRNEAFNNDGATPSPFYDFDLTFWDTTRYTNWQKVLIGNSDPFTNVQTNISGGTTNTQFVVGVGYANQGTVFPGDYSDKKISGHVSITNFSNDHKFHTQFTANYINDNSNLPSVDLTPNIILAPDAPALYDANGNLNWQFQNGSATWNNPLAYTYIHANATTQNLISSLNLSYQILNGLQLTSNFGYNFDQMGQTILVPSTAYGPPVNLNPSRRINQFGNTQNKSWIIEPQLVYSKVINKGKLDVLLGTTFQENNSNSIGFRASGFTSDALIPNPQAASSLRLLGSSYSLYHYDAVFGRIGYNWDEKYLINLTARRDGSSRFGPDKQFGNFGAVGVGWIFSNEKFIRDGLPFLSFGKLRASYGTTGNDQIGDYQYLSLYRSNPLAYQTITGLFPTALTNPNFAWELVKKLEGGLEFGFLKDKIFISASLFRNRSGNQLLGQPLPNITGFNTVQANLPATVQNTGQEFTLKTINVQDRKFNWSTSGNITFLQNKIIAFPDLANSAYANTYAVGNSIFSTFRYHYTGVDPQTGIYTFATKNQSGIPSLATDLVRTKPITQKFFGGLNNSFNYDHFHLDIFIQFVSQYGYNYYGSTELDNNYPGTFNANQPTNLIMNRWQYPGNKNAVVEKLSQSGGGPLVDAYFNWLNSDGALSDNSFIRVKNISFSYDLPDSWLKQAHLKQLRFYFQCQNLFTIASASFVGLDPETMGAGGLGLPPLRMITFGIQAAL
jgi:TonB-dependent starch-binding outer membrane protein SusC